MTVHRLLKSRLLSRERWKTIAFLNYREVIATPIIRKNIYGYKYITRLKSCRPHTLINTSYIVFDNYPRPRTMVGKILKLLFHERKPLIDFAQCPFRTHAWNGRNNHFTTNYERATKRLEHFGNCTVLELSCRFTLREWKKSCSWKIAMLLKTSIVSVMDSTTPFRF